MTEKLLFFHYYRIFIIIIILLLKNIHQTIFLLIWSTLVLQT